MATRIKKTDLARDALYNKVNTMIDEVNTKIDNKDSLPSQTGNAGKFLTTDGTNASWGKVKQIEIKQDLTNPSTNTVPSTKAVKTAIDAKDSLPSQSGNDGKFLTTNGTTTSWATVNVDTSDIYNKLDSKQDKSTAVNYGNISNCITEIPQDIKLELNNNNTIVLKKGSIVYIPNGTGNFDKVTITQDVSDGADSNRETMLFYRVGQNSLEAMPVEFCFSSSTAPTSFLAGNYAVWYDTTNNVIKLTKNGGTNWDSGYSFPICLAHETTTTYSISQVFNGFGYIGSTVFALPGVKGLIPNGRNADGSLKSIEVVQNSVKIMTMASYMAGRKHCPLELFFNNELSGMEIDVYLWGTVATLKDIPRDKVYAAYYCLEDNLVHYFNSTGVESINKSLFAATFAVGDDNKITSFIPKTVFHALDYNDKSTISGWSMPSSQYIDLTLGRTGTVYTAPANGWVYISKTSGDVNQSLTAVNITRHYSTESRPYAKGSDIRLLFPVSKGDRFQIHYTASSSTSYFRFIFAEGEPYNPVSSSGGIGGGSIEIGGIGGPDEGGQVPDWGD